MSRLTRDGTTEPVSRDQIPRHARGQKNINLSCSADHEQDWQPYPVDPYSAICDDHTYIHTYIYILRKFDGTRRAEEIGRGHVALRENFNACSCKALRASQLEMETVKMRWDEDPDDLL